MEFLGILISLGILGILVLEFVYSRVDNMRFLKKEKVKYSPNILVNSHNSGGNERNFKSCFTNIGCDLFSLILVSDSASVSSKAISNSHTISINNPPVWETNSDIYISFNDVSDNNFPMVLVLSLKDKLRNSYEITLSYSRGNASPEFKIISLE